MKLNTLNENLNIHQSLPNQPTLTAEELKEAWDKASNIIKDFINNTLIPDIENGVNTDMTTLENSLNESFQTLKTEIETDLENTKTNLEESMNNLEKSNASSISTVNANLSSKTIYNDITIEQHQVTWGGGQVYQGRSFTDASNTIKLEGYYPIGVVGVEALADDRVYVPIKQTKSAGSITVEYRWYHATNVSIAPGDMAGAMIYVAWVRIR